MRTITVPAIAVLVGGPTGGRLEWARGRRRRVQKSSGSSGGLESARADDVCETTKRSSEPTDPTNYYGRALTPTKLKPQPSILSMLHGRASLRPDDVAFTFTDYQHDPAGVSESLTWSQLSRRTVNVARELSVHGTVGDRAVILAPQGLEYILAFLGSMQAGLVAVPLPLPHRGSSHERVAAVFADTKPTMVLTTSAVAGDVGDYVDQSRVDTAPKIVEIDSLNLAGPMSAAAEPGLSAAEFPSTAYLQYSSGSTRLPTGVMISHHNLQVNFEQLMRSLFAGVNVGSSSDLTIVSWLPFYHDMGLVLGICAPILGGYHAELTSPVGFLEKPGRWMRALAENPHAFSGAPNFAFELAARKTSDSDLGDSISVACGASSTAPNVSIRRRWTASQIGSRTSTSGTTCCARPTDWPRRRSSWRAEPGMSRRGRSISMWTSWPKAALGGVRREPALRW